jgi:uncharacterized RDD family membrane protein YckC
VTDVVTGEAVVLDVPCARFPSRMVAQIIDMVIQLALLTGLIIITGRSGTRMNAAATAAAGLVVLVVTIVGYPTIFETVTRGKSPGKMALGLRVVADDGGPERFRQALVRALAGVIEIWALTGAPALICSLLSSRGKRLGDLFAGTFVIQERMPRRPDLPAEFAAVPGPLAGWAQHLELSALTDQAADAASSYLRRFHDLTPAARDEFGQRIAAEIAAQVAPAPPQGTPPAAFIAAVLAVRRGREMARLAAEQQRWQERTAAAGGPLAEAEPARPAGPGQPAARTPGPGQPGPGAAAPGQPGSWPPDPRAGPEPLGSGIPPDGAPAESDATDSGHFTPPG